MRSRKANALADGAIIMAVIFSVVLVVIVANYSVVKPFNDMVQADPEMSATSKQISQTTNGHYGRTWDAIIPFLLVMMWAAAMASALFIDSHPVFFVFTCIGLIVILSVAANLEQTYEDVIGDSEYSTASTDLPNIHWVMENIVLVMIVIVLGIAVALYGKGFI